ncbi:MAG: hypothetical protein M3O22_00475 [Pseudomonadota bacterium]|nr:hypothetical protein [Pseudomonadota bacterium]
MFDVWLRNQPLKRSHSNPARDRIFEGWMNSLKSRVVATGLLAVLGGSGLEGCYPSGTHTETWGPLITDASPQVPDSGFVDGGSGTDAGRPDSGPDGGSGTPDAGMDGGTPTVCSPTDAVHPGIDPRDGTLGLFDPCGTRQELWGYTIHEVRSRCWQTNSSLSKEAAWAITRGDMDRANFLKANTIRLPTETSYTVGWYLTAAEAQDPDKIQKYNDKVWTIRTQIDYARQLKMRVHITPWDVAVLEQNEGVPSPASDGHFMAMVRLTYDDDVIYDLGNEYKNTLNYRTDLQIFVQRWQQAARAGHVIRREEDRINAERRAAGIIEPVKRHLLVIPGLHWWSRDANFLLLLKIKLPSHLNCNEADPLTAAGFHPYNRIMHWDGTTRVLEDHLRIGTDPHGMLAFMSEGGIDEVDMIMESWLEFVKLNGGQRKLGPDGGFLEGPSIDAGYLCSATVDGGTSCNHRPTAGFYAFSLIPRPGCHPAMYEERPVGVYVPTSYGIQAECVVNGTCSPQSAMTGQTVSGPVDGGISTLFRPHGPEEAPGYHLLDASGNPILETDIRPWAGLEAAAQSQTFAGASYYMMHRQTKDGPFVPITRTSEDVPLCNPAWRDGITFPLPDGPILRLQQ